MKEPLLEVVIELPHGGRRVVGQYQTIAAAFRGLEAVANAKQADHMWVDTTEAGKKHFGLTGVKHAHSGLRPYIGNPPQGFAGCTFTDFGEPPRREVIGRHKTRATAIRQYRRIWDIYHKLHGHRTWLYLAPHWKGQ